MVKVYQLKRLSAGRFQTRYKGTTINLEFVNGRGGIGSDKAELVTNNPFVQEAIENDARYGSVFILSNVYEDLNGATEVNVEQTAYKENVNKGRRYFKPVVPVEDAAVNGKGKKGKKTNGKTDENGKTDGETIGNGGESNGNGGDDVVETSTVVEDVRTLNDAYDFFANHGVNVESKDALVKVMKSMNIEFPNLEM